MMLRALTLVTFAALVGCGVSGPPESQRERNTNTSISGTATIGLDGSF